MNILYAVHGYKPAYRIGGPVLSVSALAETLVRKGHQVTVFTTNSNLDQDLDVPLDQPVDVEGVNVWYFRREDFFKRWVPFIPYLSRSMGYLYCPKMAEQFEHFKDEIDLIHTHLPFIYPTYIAAKAARRFGKPLFYHARGVLDPGRLKFRSLKKWLYIGAVERPIMSQATMLIALNEAEVESYRALGVKSPCRVIPNGIDIANYREQPCSDVNTQWKIPPDSLVILFLGRLHPIKGVDKLLEAFLRIQHQFPKAILVMAGPDEWKEEKKFRELIAQAGGGEHVIFTGMVTGDTKLDLLARANLFCLPSVAEGFSIAMLEALASATPVLLSPGCHFPAVETAGAGRIAPAEPEKLAAALADLLSQPDKLQAMGRAGRDLVAKNYSWDHITDQLLETYREGIERSRSQ